MSYDIDYLTLLSQQYPTVKTASTEIIRLQSRQKLPKLTEHFMSDIHGEYESFLHILKNASGVIKDKITQIYGRTLSERDRQVLATLIYYPEQKLEYIKDEVDDMLKANGITIEHDKGYDVAYVANMFKADFFKKSLADEAHLCKHIKCYLDDIDGDPCRAFDEFFATCIGKGIPVIWSDVI